MAEKVKVSSAKRFGARYGRRLKEKVSRIEEATKSQKICPYCKKANGIKREAKGIWTCSKCGAKFTGKAYTIN